eukprot:12500926-Prorocentrum_lima.AAC.1
MLQDGHGRATSDDQYPPAEGYFADHDEYTITEMIGFIVDVIKDELHEECAEFEDTDLKLTIHFPSQ